MASWDRIMTTSAKARSPMTMATMTYMTPILLWSTEVSHSVQSHFHFFRYVTRAARASTQKIMKPKAPMMMGLLNGMADRENLPSMSSPCGVRCHLRRFHPAARVLVQH